MPSISSARDPVTVRIENTQIIEQDRHEKLPVLQDRYAFLYKTQAGEL